MVTFAPVAQRIREGTGFLKRPFACSPWTPSLAARTTRQMQDTITSVAHTLRNASGTLHRVNIYVHVRARGQWITRQRPLKRGRGPVCSDTSNGIDESLLLAG